MTRKFAVFFFTFLFEKNWSYYKDEATIDAREMMETITYIKCEIRNSPCPIFSWNFFLNSLHWFCFKEFIFGWKHTFSPPDVFLCVRLQFRFRECFHFAHSWHRHLWIYRLAVLLLNSFSCDHQWQYYLTFPWFFFIRISKHIKRLLAILFWIYVHNHYGGFEHFTFHPIIFFQHFLTTYNPLSTFYSVSMLLYWIFCFYFLSNPKNVMLY